GPAQAHDLAIQIDVFAAGEFRIEAGAEFQKCGDAPARHYATRGRLQDAADDLQQGALAAAVGAYQAQHFALLYLEADVLERPEIAMVRARARQQFAQAVAGAAVQTRQFGNVLNEDQLSV